MNWLKVAKEAQNKRTALLNKAKEEKRAFTDEEKTEFENLKTEITNALAMHEAEKDSTELTNQLNEPANAPAVANLQVKPGQEPKFFDSLSEQLRLIRNAKATGSPDERLLKANNAASGLNTGVGEEGGFAIQKDFMGNMLETAAKEDPILSLVTSFSVSTNSNRVNWNEIDETDISSTVFGGVQVYRTPEAGTIESSKPKMKQAELKLEKLAGLCYTTDEMEEDSDFTGQLIDKSFNVALRRTLASEIMSGDGIGRCTGILTGDGLVEVAKETNQAADSIKWKNISKMYHRMLNRGEGSWAWIIHPDAHEQLDFLDFPVGTGGVPVYLPATMQGTVDTLRRLPVLESDHCSALGDKGDIVLADLSDYLLVMKKGVNKAVSMHVEFLTAQMAYRFILRVNGRPMKTSTVTINNSNNERGKYIALADRA